MRHLGDITKISGYDAPVVNVIIGGSPCQDLSVAGKRAGTVRRTKPRTARCKQNQMAVYLTTCRMFAGPAISLDGSRQRNANVYRDSRTDGRT